MQGPFGDLNSWLRPHAPNDSHFSTVGGRYNSERTLDNSWNDLSTRTSTGSSDKPDDESRGSANNKAVVPSDADDPTSKNMTYNAAKETWDCTICRKSFREKIDLYQHLKSGTHDARKFTCGDCGRSFVSMGALTQHSEQAGHNVGTINTFEKVPTKETPPTNYYTMNDSQSKLEPVNLRKPELPMWKNSPLLNSSVPSMYPPPQPISTPHAYLAKPITPYDPTPGASYYGNNNYPPPPTIAPAYSNPSSTNTIPPNQFLFSGYSLRNHNRAECALYFVGISMPRSTDASCAWLIRDELRNVVVSEGGRYIRQVYPDSLLPDYEGLNCGLIDAFNKGLTSVRVMSDNELLLLHLSKHPSITRYQSIHHRSVEDIAHQVLMNSGKFPDITFHLVSKECNNHVRRIASKYL